ncbi:MAG: hypothetical protein JWL77_3733 [Chthonomonadaceae bacterium]|nr:hypothetical protein [Chthonomonadaceae bacterium]
MLQRICQLVLAISILTLSHTTAANAQTYNAASFSLPQAPTQINLVNGLDGFDFTPSADLTVTALGWYDHNGDGLIHVHPVGIYTTSTQTLAAPSAVVTTSSALDALIDFRFTSVTPFTLTAGTTYTLVGYGEGPDFDPYVNSPSGGITFGPDVNFLRIRTSRSSGLEFPTTAGEIGLQQGLFFGPNFKFTTAALSTPEPNALLMLMGGGAAAGVSLLRRRRKYS